MLASGLQGSRRARTARSLPPPMPGSPYGQWQLVNEIARGAWTCVYSARPAASPTSGPPGYALKLPRPDRAGDNWPLALLCREARAARQVAHPHLITVLAASLRHAPYYLAMPLLAGRTLEAELLAGPPPAAEALWIVRQVAEALTALHAAGWLHGDVKPANILVGAGGHVTLLDLGFARRLDEAAEQAPATIEGTPHYMPPEALARAGSASAAGDIYSLGAVLLEMLAGRAQGTVDRFAALAARPRLGPAGPIRGFIPHATVRLSRLLQQMVANQPLRRPTAAEVVERLVSLEIEMFADRCAVR